MSSSTDGVADVGVLSPVWVGTRAEQLTSDRAVVSAMEAAFFALNRIESSMPCPIAFP